MCEIVMAQIRCLTSTIGFFTKRELVNVGLGIIAADGNSNDVTTVEPKMLLPMIPYHHSYQK